jgi:hypothetical protein
LLPVDDHDGPVLLPIHRCRKSLGCDEASSISDYSVASPLPLCASFNTQVMGCGFGNKTRWVTSRRKSRSSKRRAFQNDSKEQDRNNVFTASAFADIIQMTSRTDVHVAGSPAHHHNLKENYKEGERETKENEGHYTVSTGVAAVLEEDRRALHKRWQGGNSVAGKSQE